MNNIINIVEVLSERLIQIQNKYELSDSQLASRIGIYVNDLEQFRTGKLNGDDSFITAQISKFIERSTRQFYETKLVRVVQKMLATVYKEKEIAVITSVSGAGKTTAIEKFCMENSYALHIRVTEVFTTKYLLQILCRAVELPSHGLPRQLLFEQLSDSVTRRPVLFVIDEAERLDVPQLEVMRDLFDEGNIGLALVGLESLRVLLKRGKSLRENLVQLYSRVAYQRVVDILEPEDVSMVLNDRLIKNKISTAMHKNLSKKFKTNGGFRAIIKLANIINKESLVNEIKSPDDQFVEHCLTKLIL